jgi:hypothetical protein
MYVIRIVKLYQLTEEYYSVRADMHYTITQFHCGNVTTARPGHIENMRLNRTFQEGIELGECILDKQVKEPGSDVSTVATVLLMSVRKGYPTATLIAVFYDIICSF